MKGIEEYVRDTYGSMIADNTCEWCYADAILEYMSDHPRHFNKTGRNSGRIMQKHIKEYNACIKQRSYKKCFYYFDDEFNSEVFSLCGYHLGRLAEEIQHM